MGFFGGGASVDLASPPAIGNTTPNTGAFTTLSASGSASIGTTANYQCLNIAQATSNPSNLPFISLTNHGPATIYAKGGYFSFNSQNAGIHIVGNTASVRFGTTEGAASDVVILRENATGVLAQRAGTTAQTFRLYNTYTDASNYERGFFRWNTNVLEIGAEAAGTGTKRNLRVVGPSLASAEAVPALEVTQTWNTTGTPSAILLNVTNTASNTASRLIDLKIGGTTKFAVEALTGSAFTITQYGFTLAGRTDFQDAVGLTSNGEYRIGGDVILARDAANVFAQRRTTNAQTFRLYRTFTDASNYERLGFIATRTTRFAIAAENAGTGAARSLEISFYTSASDPASTDITDGCFSVWKNSGTGTIKLWANDGGTMKSVALA